MTDYREKILDAAQEIVQKQGFNGFSYRDLAKAVGIRTSSIHYYFPTKNDLGEAIMKRYGEKFQAALRSIDNKYARPVDKIRALADIFAGALKQDRICLGGMMAADYTVLSEAVRVQIRKFFSDSETWLAGVLREGREKKIFKFDGPPEAKAEAIFSGLEGSMIAARLFGREKRWVDAARWMEASLQ